MFPTTEINISEDKNSTKTFAWVNGDFLIKDGKISEVDDLSALKIWVEKILFTNKNKYKIYSEDGFGTTIQDTLFSTLPYDMKIEEIKREIKEGLQSNANISTISNFQFSRENRTLSISMTINSTYGTFESEVELNS